MQLCVVIRCACHQTRFTCLNGTALPCLVLIYSKIKVLYIQFVFMHRFVHAGRTMHARPYAFTSLPDDSSEAKLVQEPSKYAYAYLFMLPVWS